LAAENLLPVSPGKSGALKTTTAASAGKKVDKEIQEERRRDRYMIFSSSS
jgi:hypothetical protein